MQSGPSLPAPHILVIGAGSTGCAVAHDLALRGLRVTLVERGGIASETTGHNQAQMHSGARYAVVDPESAVECIQENRILRQILPDAVEWNGGLFVAVSEGDLEYRRPFLEACANCGIPTEEISPAEALRREPRLHPGLLAAVHIPDGVFDPYRFRLSFLASACTNGARVWTFSEVVGLDPQGGVARIYRRTDRCELRLDFDAAVNAAGPWVDRVARLGGGNAPVEASAGAMVTVAGRLCSQVINRLAPPADGDILVPQRATVILGTTSWTVADPGDIHIPPEQIELLFEVGEQMIPAVRHAAVRGVMAAARPLLVQEGAGGRRTTRGYAVYDHSAEGSPGFFSVVGGKTTTARKMAEDVGDRLSAYLDWPVASRTRETRLRSYRDWARTPCSL